MPHHKPVSHQNKTQKKTKTTRQNKFYFSNLKREKIINETSFINSQSAKSDAASPSQIVKEFFFKLMILSDRLLSSIPSCEIFFRVLISTTGRLKMK